MAGPILMLVPTLKPFALFDNHWQAPAQVRRRTVGRSLAPSAPRECRTLPYVGYDIAATHRRPLSGASGLRHRGFKSGPGFDLNLRKIVSDDALAVASHWGLFRTAAWQSAYAAGAERIAPSD